MVGRGCYTAPAVAIDRIPLPAGVTGRLYATGFTDVGPDPDAALDAVDAHVLLCLLTDHDIELRYPRFAHWLAHHRHGRAWHFRIDDGGVADDDEMAALTDRVVERLLGGTAIVTHCGAGLGRTSLVCGLALVRLSGSDLDEALATVRAARPGTGPENPTQRAQLERLAARPSGATPP